jgi:uroporphyrinogen-III synthase/uroporphyrinogen III methyltransferase/synthase
MLPLAGRRILVTRALEQAGKLSDSLRALGAEPVEVPVLEIGPPQSFAALDKALVQLNTYSWLIFTSANAVKALILRALALRIPLAGRVRKIAAVGPATAEVVTRAGLTVDYIPEKYVAESLIAGFPGEIQGRRFLLARAAIARDVIPDALRAAGAEVDIAEAYRNVLPESAPQALKQALAQPIHAATFTSSSTVTHLAEAANKANIPFPLPGVPAVSIGPVTSQTLREHNWLPAAEADPHDIPGLIAAVQRVLHKT